MSTLSVTVRDYDAVTLTQDWAAHLNKRAEARGWSARFELDVQRQEVEQVVLQDGLAPLVVPMIQWVITVIGTPMKYEGWSLLAVLDWDEHAGLVVRAVPGTEVPPSMVEGVRERWCDHCRTNRQRTDTYLIAHEDGRVLTVGSTCLRDFLGWDARIVFPPEVNFADVLGAGGFGGANAWPTDVVLAVALACMREHGWRSSQEDGSTKNMVLDVLDPRTPTARKLSSGLSPIWRGILESGEIELIRKAIAEWSGDSSYEYNVKQVLQADHISTRNIGIAASAPLKYWRDQAQGAKRDAPVSQHIGAIKERITVRVRVISVTPIPGNYGTTYLYGMLDENGNVLKWFSSNHAFGDKPSDDTFVIQGTVKAHETWREERQTILTRCKEVK